MDKNLIGEIFVILKRAGLASSESEFSELWLGHSECYLRTLRFKRAEPSLGALAICASRLQKAGQELIVVTRYEKLGRHCLELSARCHQEINKSAAQLLLS